MGSSSFARPFDPQNGQANKCIERDAEPAADLRFSFMSTVLSGGGFSAAHAVVLQRQQKII